jgi:multiple sugar transport system substrate-binding protein
MSRMPRRTRHLPLVATLGAAGMLLAACSSGPAVPTSLDPDADVTITWWTGQADEGQALLEELAAEFEDLHPNVTVEVSSGAPSTDDLLQKMSASFAAGTYPDVSYAYGSWASELEATGKTQDITDQVAEIGWDEFSEAARSTAQPTGDKTIGIPALVDNVSLIYNTTVFDAAGVAYPTDDWTWDDFRAAAKALTDPSTNTYGYGYSVSGTEDTTWQFWPHLWQNGGEILSEDGTTATFDSPAGVEALTFLRDMAVEDQSVYLDQTDTKYTQLFANDLIGMVTSGPWTLYDLQTAGTSYGVAQLPGTDGNHETVSGPDLWVLLDHGDPNRAYWSFELISWLTETDQDLRWNVAYGNLPLRSSEMATPEFAAQVQAMPGLDVMAQNSANAVHVRPTVAGYTGLSEAIAHAIGAVMQGQGDPAEALHDAAAEATDALADN